MKLIQPSKAYHEDITIELGGYKPGPVARFFGAKPIKGKDLTYSGRRCLTSCLIDFSSELLAPQLGVRLCRPVVFGDKLYHGIIPLENTEGTFYSCTVDHIDDIVIGEI